MRCRATPWSFRTGRTSACGGASQARIPSPSRPRPQPDAAHRYADPVITPDGRWVICVHEQHRSDAEVDNDLVAVPLDPPAPDEPPGRWRPATTFSLAPTVAGRGPAGLAQLGPSPHALGPDPAVGRGLRPADMARRMRTYRGRRRRVRSPSPAGQPSGVLHYVSDRSGWWNLYDETGTALCPLDAEFAGPDWVFGNRPATGSCPMARWSPSGRESRRDRSAASTGGRATPHGLPFPPVRELQPAAGRRRCHRRLPERGPGGGAPRLDRGGSACCAAAGKSARRPEFISTPDAVTFPTAGGRGRTPSSTHPPTRPSKARPTSDHLVVMIHGGPTAGTAPCSTCCVQYWTSRGFAVADVDYRGSSGYGTGLPAAARRRPGASSTSRTAPTSYGGWRAGPVDGAGR